MWQYYVTGLIVVAAVVYTVYRLITYFSDPLRKCRKCTMDCGGCPLEELKRNKEQGTGKRVKGQS